MWNFSTDRNTKRLKRTVSIGQYKNVLWNSYRLKCRNGYKGRFNRTVPRMWNFHISEHEKVIKDAFNGTVHTHTRNGIHTN